VIIGAVIGILLSVFFFTPIYQRIFGDDAGASASRAPMNQVAFQIIKDHPVFGAGANNYYFIQRQYLGLNSNVVRYVVHNKYLLVWSETGILGLLFFVLFLISTIRQGFKISRFEDHLLSPLALGFTAAIAGQMVHMFFDIFNNRPQTQLLWLVSGFLVIISFMRRSDKDIELLDNGLIEIDRNMECEPSVFKSFTKNGRELYSND
jgi:O-antigen ligase